MTSTTQTQPMFHAGQTVILIEPGRTVGRRETTVTKVGRKLAYADVYGRAYAFDLMTGVQHNNTYGSPMYITTPEMIAAQDERAAAVARLAELGVTSTGFGGFAQSTETLHKLIALLEAEG